MTLVLIVSAVVTSPAHAQWQATAQFTTREGLAQSQVTALLQEPRGYLWIGTMGGLSRYDGRRFVTFGTAEGMPDEMVTALALDRHVRLLVGTDSGGVAIWDGERMATAPPGAGEPGAPVLAVLARGEGESLLVATTAGLFVRGPGATPRSLVSTPVRAVLPMALDDLLLVDGGVILSDRLGRTKALQSRLGRSASIVAGTATENGALLALRDGSIVRLGRDGAAVPVTPTALDDITALLRGRDGELWIGTERGLWRLEPGRDLVNQPLRPGGHASPVSALLEDFEGNLWVGTSGDGLYQVTPSPFAVLNRDSGMPDDNAWAFVEDERRCMWIATEAGGVVQWCNGHVERHLAPGRDLPSARAMCLARTPGGVLWVGTARGLARVGPAGDIQLWDRSKGLPDAYVMALATGPGDTLWVGTRGGLARMQAGKLQSWTPADGLPDNEIRDLTVDRAGGLWIATFRNGLVRFDGDRFVRIAEAEGLPGRRVWCVIIDARGVVWAGTDRGLWIRDAAGGASRIVTTREGLPSQNVLSLVQDHDGNVWAGTNRGVALLSQVGAVIRTFTPRDGLSASESNESAARCDSTGRVWLGMETGITIADPRFLTADTHPPRLILEQMTVDGRPWGKPFPLASGLPAPEPFLHLPAGSREIRFDFAALGLRAPDALRYRCRLEGYETLPSLPTEENHATYRTLPPRRYRFVLEARNSEGVWTTEPLAATFVIPPLWYQATWFRAAASLGLVLTLVLAVGGRLRQLRRRQSALEDEVAQRTTELNQAYRRIAEQNTQLQDLSRTDPLTGLKNRRFLEEQLPAEMAVLRREVMRLGASGLLNFHGATVYLVDLDGFKAINDTFGHDAGDLVLKGVARTLMAMMREGDLAIRWGGDELLILARGINQDGALQFARRVLGDIARLRVPLPDGREMSVRASIGFLPYPLAVHDFLPTDEWPALIRATDRLMYFAKEHGGGRGCGLVRSDTGYSAPGEAAILAHLTAHPGDQGPSFSVVEVVADES